MGFAENIQFLRQKKGYTQEQLAEQLQVSRQSVSKWESGGSFPEMDKLIQISEMFQCSMDILLQGDAKTVCVEERGEYDRHMNEYSRAVTFGVGFILAGVAAYELMAGVGVAEKIRDMVFMIIIVVSVLIFIVQGMKHNDFIRRFPEIRNVYTQIEIDKFHKKFITMCAVGIGIILCGVIFELGMDGIALPAPFNEEAVHGVFMLLVTAAVSILVYAGMQKNKYDTKGYNKENSPNSDIKKKNEMTGMLCGVVMLVALIIFMLTGFLLEAWEVSWVTFPIGGIICGIISILRSRIR